MSVVFNKLEDGSAGNLLLGFLDEERSYILATRIRPPIETEMAGVYQMEKDRLPFFPGTDLETKAFGGHMVKEASAWCREETERAKLQVVAHHSRAHKYVPVKTIKMEGHSNGAGVTSKPGGRAQALALNHAEFRNVDIQAVHVDVEGIHLYLTNPPKLAD